MNQRTDDELHRVIREGGLAVGRSWLMPRFGGELDAVGQWDLVAYVRALHPSVTDLAPAAARWETREVVLPRAGAPGLDALRADERRVVWFIARDAAGGALGEVAFAPLDAARADSTATSAASPGTTPRWIGVLDAPSGEPLAERAFVGARPLEGRPSSSADDASIAAAAARLRRRVRAARGHLEQERARAEERLAAWRAAPAALGRGERLFLELCASCHGATGQRFGGVTRVGPDVVPARNLADPAVTRARTDDELARLVREGGLAVGISAQMPGAPHLDTAELQDLVRFVRALGDGQGEGPP